MYCSDPISTRKVQCQPVKMYNACHASLTSTLHPPCLFLTNSSHLHLNYTSISLPCHSHLPISPSLPLLSSKPPPNFFGASFLTVYLPTKLLTFTSPPPSHFHLTTSSLSSHHHLLTFISPPPPHFHLTTSSLSSHHHLLTFISPPPPHFHLTTSSLSSHHLLLTFTSPPPHFNLTTSSSLSPHHLLTLISLPPYFHLTTTSSSLASHHLLTFISPPPSHFHSPLHHHFLFITFLQWLIGFDVVIVAWARPRAVLVFTVTCVHCHLCSLSLVSTL